MFLLSILISFVMAADTAPTNSAPTPEAKVYGQTDFAAPAVTLTQVLNDFEAYKNQPVTIEAQVQQVCEQKGCWIRVEDKNVSVRAIMKGHAFSVPKEFKNKRVKMTGIMEQKELPVKVVRHYMEDEGRSKEEIKKVNAPQKVFQFVVDGVKAI